MRGLSTARITNGSHRLVELVPLLAPVILLAVARQYPAPLSIVLPRALIAVLAVGVVAAASRRPDRCLAALAALMPFQVFVPSFLLASGVPKIAVRALGGWRELLGLAIVVAAVRHAQRHRHRLDRVLVLGVAYLLLTGAYALVPTLFAADAPADVQIRSLGWRALASFVVLLLACREAGLGAEARAVVERYLLLGAAVVSAGALWEALDSASWNRFAVETIQVIQYKIEILGLRPAQLTDVRVYGVVGGHEVVRASSVFGSPIPLGHYMLLPFAVALERMLRGRTRGMTALAVAFGTAILVTQTRSALVGAVVVLAATMRRSPGRSPAQRTRFTVILAGVAIVSAPFVVAAGLTSRFDDKASNTQHQQAFTSALESVVERPMGTGIGTTAGVGQRFRTSRVIAENYYLQVAQEVGVIGGVIFLSLVVTVNRRLRRARDETGDATVAAIRSGVLGICTAAVFLHSFDNQTVSWLTFGLSGMALGVVSPASRPGRDRIDPSEVAIRPGRGRPPHLTDDR